MITQRTAIIDGDVLCYVAAAGAQSRNEDAMDLRDRVVAEVKSWADRAFCTGILCTFSCSRADNFRKDFWPTYKDNREGTDEPPLLTEAKDAVAESYKTLRQPRIEADDLMGMIGSDGRPMKDGSIPVIITIDKDLRQIPGWHFNPNKEDFPVRVTTDEADHFFYQQWLTGDTTDNIPGLFRWGPAKAAKLLDSTPRAQWDEAVKAAYYDHPKQYDLGYCLAMARCVRILRQSDWDKDKRLPILWSPRGADPSTTGQHREGCPVRTWGLLSGSSCTCGGPDALTSAKRPSVVVPQWAGSEDFPGSDFD